MVEVLLQSCHDCSDSEHTDTYTCFDVGKNTVEKESEKGAAVGRREPKPLIEFRDRDGCTALQLAGGTSEDDDDFRTQAVRDLFVKYCSGGGAANEP